MSWSHCSQRPFGGVSARWLSGPQEWRSVDVEACDRGVLIVKCTRSRCEGRLSVMVGSFSRLWERMGAAYGCRSGYGEVTAFPIPDPLNAK
jgi:hypothetical protein